MGKELLILELRHNGVSRKHSGDREYVLIKMALNLRMGFF